MVENGMFSLLKHKTKPSSFIDIVFAPDPQSLLCDPGEASGKRGDTDQRVLHHWKLQGFHNAASLWHQTHRAEENGGHVAGDFYYNKSK